MKRAPFFTKIISASHAIWVLFPLFIFLFRPAFGKDCVESKPLDIKQRGWNKVLCMKNGNTMLFHIEPTENIIVKVFDSSGKEIGSRKDHSRILDMFVFEEPVLKGIFEINGEAVLFIDQERFAKHCLVRLRYNASTGKLVEEKLIAESRSAKKRMQFYIVKDKDEDTYEVFFCTDMRHPRRQCDLFIVYFNNKHQAVKEMQLDVDRKKYDYLKVIDAEGRPNGVMITLALDKPVQYGRPDHNGPLVEGGAVYNHYLSYYFFPKDSSVPKRMMVDVTPYVYPFYSFYTYNSFANSLNSLLFSYHPYDYSFGMPMLTGSVQSLHFFKLSEDDLSMSTKRIRDSFANSFLQEQTRTDSNNILSGYPIKMTTDENGLTTLVSIAETRHYEYIKDYVNTSKYLYITRFDDDGNELWGTVLPFWQYYFERLPYAKQFLSVNAYTKNKNFYLVFNDYDTNYHNSVRDPGNPIYDVDVTNAFYYKVSSKNEVTKNYVFGQPRRYEYTSSFISGADFDERRGRYAALVQCKKNEATTLKMAWSYLE